MQFIIVSIYYGYILYSIEWAIFFKNKETGYHFDLIEFFLIRLKRVAIKK